MKRFRRKENQLNFYRNRISLFKVYNQICYSMQTFFYEKKELNFNRSVFNRVFQLISQFLRYWSNKNLIYHGYQFFLPLHQHKPGNQLQLTLNKRLKREQYHNELWYRATTKEELLGWWSNPVAVLIDEF